MAEAVVGATVEVLLQNLIAFSVEEIGLIWNFTDDLKSLKDSVATIRDFLEDAEMRQVTDKSVQRWLMKLEAVAFDADYIFDQLNYQHLRKMKKKVRCFFPNCRSFAFRHRMAREIKNIRDELKLINQKATELGLQARMANTPARGAGTDAPAYLETNSLSKDPVFIGRENDARKTVEMVNSSPTDKAISVIPIVGMGGSGKTTLAREVFWGVLKSVTGMQGKKFKDKANTSTVTVPETELNLSDSDGGSAEKTDQNPMSWPKRPTDGAGDGFVSSVRGLFTNQRKKAKAFVLRTMRGEAENKIHDEWSESEAEFSPFARQLTITKARRLIRCHTKKFRSKKGLGNLL